MKKILIIFGTRPEAIKMAPLIKKISESDCFSVKICVTAQHRGMLDSVLQLFKIEPDYDLDLMSKRQTLTDITVRVLQGLEVILIKEKPDIVLVHGDTTTTFSAALAAFYQQIPVGHVEAGLRSGNINSPYPEEMNRILTDGISNIHFAPTEGNRKNLLKSGVKDEQIFVTGNTVIDALYLAVQDGYRFELPLLNELDYNNKKVILLTAHRRENWGDRLNNIFLAVRELITNNPSTVLVFPVHMNPLVKEPANELLGSAERIHLIPPLDYAPFANLMARSYMVLTDSGGIQEEAPALGKPVLVLRKETERPEAVVAGTVKIAGVDKERIIALGQELIGNQTAYDKMAKAVNPYGDGKASAMITEILKRKLN